MECPNPQEIFDSGMRLLGWQGGTIHQVRNALAEMVYRQGKTVDDRLVVHEQVGQMLTILKRKEPRGLAKMSWMTSC